MSGPVENSINVLIKELKDNRKVDKDEALEYVGYVFRLITQTTYRLISVMVPLSPLMIVSRMFVVVIFVVLKVSSATGIIS